MDAAPYPDDGTLPGGDINEVEREGPRLWHIAYFATRAVPSF